VQRQNNRLFEYCHKQPDCVLGVARVREYSGKLYDAKDGLRLDYLYPVFVFAFVVLHSAKWQILNKKPNCEIPFILILEVNTTKWNISSHSFWLLASVLLRRPKSKPAKLTYALLAALTVSKPLHTKCKESVNGRDWKRTNVRAYACVTRFGFNCNCVLIMNIYVFKNKQAITAFFSDESKQNILPYNKTLSPS